MTKNQGNSDEHFEWHKHHDYRPVINVSGTMTGLGSSVVAPEVRAEVGAAMECFVRIHDMQSYASKVIARLTGANAGFLTASASAGITLAVAATMTGRDPALIEALPKSPGQKNKVAIQLGHLCHYGAPVSTAIELTGAEVRTFGQSTQAADYQLEAALTEDVTAALYVVSHHVVHYGQIPFLRFAEICRDKQVPVIVDAASETDLTGFIAGGADMVMYSGHKFMGGPTSGIVAGRRDAIRAAYMQNIGIGRGMKIGKESIAGAIAAMLAWSRRDHASCQRTELGWLQSWQTALKGAAGIIAKIVDDPTGNPIKRLQIEVNAGVAGANAAYFSQALSRLDPAIVVRDHELEHGYFQLDPCNLLTGQAEMVATALIDLMGAGSDCNNRKSISAGHSNYVVDGYLDWTA